jgi:large subunit ribosomal protein L4
MSGPATYTKSGTKATKEAVLNKKIFAEKVENHELLKLAYSSYLAEKRTNLAKTKKRGEVQGSTIKPWKQKGTGRARFGSRYNPLWRGGGITFGPSGEENYTKRLNKQAKRKALRQALSLASQADKLKVVDSFEYMDKKTKEMANFLDKIQAKGRILCVVEELNREKSRATQNIPELKVVSGKYLTVYDLLNADTIIMSKKSLEVIDAWLSPEAKVAVKVKEEAK